MIPGEGSALNKMLSKDANAVLCELKSKQRVTIYDWKTVSGLLTKVSRFLLCELERENLKLENLDVIAQILREASLHLKCVFSEEFLFVVIQCYRILRNACFQQKNIQNYLCDLCIHDTVNLLQLLSELEEKHCDNVTLSVQVAVQFLGHTLVDNKKNQKIIWENCFPMLMDYLSHAHLPVANCVSMLIYNIFLGNPEINLREDSDDICLLIRCMDRGSEFAEYILELLLKRENTFKCFYHKVNNTEEQLQLLDTVWSVLLKGKERSEDLVSADNIIYLARRFKKDAEVIFFLLAKEDPKPLEIVRLLDIVTCASDSQPYLEELQKDRALLIISAFLLKGVTDLGKSSENVFTSKLRLAEFNPNKRDAETSPVFGFKSSLIRLIGNLCYKHRANQNEVREIGCLPVVLDACNIDGYNPLLLQWSILAVRNLMEDNLENQRVIANLIEKGPAPSAVLNELGITLHQGPEGKLCVAPLQRNS